MHSIRAELPALDTGAGIYGGGDSVGGPLCWAVAILIFMVQP